MSTKVLPITIKQFTSIAERLWLQRNAGRPRKIGLAISGGVDSMALASLVVRTAEPQALQSMKAFIVDHKLRQESTDEAHKVKSKLQNMGLNAEILSSESDDSPHQHVERLARTVRFQLLGKACRKHGIDTLLLAHHADDQVETVLVRFLQRYYGPGLSGIKESTYIPECQGIYGVAASGSPMQIKEQHLYTGDDEGPVTGFTFRTAESGGLTIIRPLLAFTKEQLVATCVSESVEWVEDKTNADVTLTTRNTIRSLYQQNLLPHALRPQKILQLAERVQTSRFIREFQVDNLLPLIDIKLDPAYGQLICHIPRECVLAVKLCVQPALVRARLLDVLITMVSPQEEIYSWALSYATSAMENNFLDEGIKNKSGATIEVIKNDDGSCFYRIARVNPHRNYAPMTPVPEANIVEGDTVWTQWVLFDQRYWIRLGQRRDGPGLPDNLTITTLRPDDLANTDTELHRARLLYSKITAKLRVKNRFRYSLPVIRVQDRAVVFPSLSIELDRRWSDASLGRREDDAVDFSYEIRYKAIRPEFTEPVTVPIRRVLK